MKVHNFNTTSGPRVYKYTAIPSKHDIRCLTLEPGLAEDPIVCHLASRKIVDSPPFEAISYVWGNAALLDYEITCDGQSLFITPNLAKALRQCRLPHAERILWADSICINQSDDTEKENQVANMGRIYSEAEKVLICLGPDLSNHAAALQSLVDDVNLMFEKTLSTISGDWGSFPAPHNEEPLMRDERWKAFAAFIKHSWFQRGWVIQEAFLAQEAYFIWGNTRISWLQLMRTSVWGWNRVGPIINRDIAWVSDAHTGIYLTHRKSEAKTFQESSKGSVRDLLFMLEAARSHAFTDDRDRVYAVLGLPVAKFITQKGGFSPSYTKDVLDVYRDFASYYIQNAPQHPLRILQYAQGAAFEDQDNVNKGQPSWVPIWHRRMYGNNVEVLFEEAEVIAPALPQTKYQSTIHDRALICSGIILDTVVDVSSSFEREVSTITDVILSWRDVGRKHAICNHLVYDRPLLAFIHLIRCGRTWDTTGPQQLSIQLQAWTALLEGTCLQGTNEAPDWWEQSICLSRLFGRCVAVTKRGYFCLLPARAKVGDLVCILYGTQVPFVLRRQKRDGVFRLIGMAYMVSLQRKKYPFGWYYLKVGKGTHAHEDWLDWDTENEEFTLI